MALGKVEAIAQRLLVRLWDDIKAVLSDLNVPTPRPTDDGYRLFEVRPVQAADGPVEVDIARIVFQLPERFSAPTGRTNLYVHVRGRLGLDANALQEGRLRTTSFNTEVAYFRHGRAGLKHVFGAHYDSDAKSLAHPVFHAQMKCYNERGSDVSDSFSLDCASESVITGVFGTARIPTAQLDFFSVVMQLCADHLIDENADDTRRLAFNRMRELRHRFQGAGYAWPFGQAAECMRSAHWYDDAPPIALV